MRTYEARMLALLPAKKRKQANDVMQCYGLTYYLFESQVDYFKAKLK
jgi:hypothetical protein